jgi:hypothetical protein
MMTPVQQKAMVAAITSCMFVAAILFGEFPLVKYTPENNRDIFLLMMPPSSSSSSNRIFSSSSSYLQEQLRLILHEQRGKNMTNQTNVTARSNITKDTKTKLLVCTMLTNDFRNYAAGAAKLAHSILVTSAATATTATTHQKKSRKGHKNDVQVLWQRHGIETELGILEMQVFPSAIYNLLLKLFCGLDGIPFSCRV